MPIIPHLEIFVKPKRKNNWHAHNEAAHQEAINRSIAHDLKVRQTRERKGFKSLKRPAHKVRFGTLPKRDRPRAEAELNRLILRHMERTGTAPSQMKLMSLMANACWIIRYARSGKTEAWLAAHRNHRRLLDRLDASQARLGTPAEPPRAPRTRRASWRGLAGV